MSEPLVTRGRLTTFAWLLVVWLALWESVSPGTIVTGVLVNLVVLAALRGYGPQKAPHIRPLAMLRYAGAFFVMLVQATWSVARTVLSWRMSIHPAVITVTLPPSSELVVTIVANSVTLTPGTLTLDATMNDDGQVRLTVHALDAPDMEATRQDVRRLHRLATAAFSTKEPQ